MLTGMRIVCVGLALIALSLRQLFLVSWEYTINGGAVSLAISATHRAQQQRQQHSEKPIFFLHAGPHKTGTTTIQDSFDINPVLHMDNYTFLGMRNPRERDDSHWQVRKLLGQFIRKRSTKFFDELEQEIASSKMNLIMSEENFSFLLNQHSIQNGAGHQFFTTLKRILADYRIVVAVGYKRYHQWIPSVYNQIHKNKKYKESFVEWFRNENRSPHVFFNPLYHGMKEYFENVEVINLHSPSTPDLMTNVYCNILPNAMHSCKWHKKQLQRTLSERANPSVPTWPFAIAATAMDDGLRARTNITLLSEEVQAYSTGINYTLPLICLSESEQESLLNESLQFEEELFPDLFHSLHGETELRKSFTKVVQKNELCSVDAASVIQDEKWRAFFSQSNKPTGNVLPSGQQMVGKGDFQHHDKAPFEVKSKKKRRKE
mmetsp:Transcript_31149/g.53230  ORF Transcript_31149/g.53230 Transcript_31149/m.53230 type:complete len:432 (-) Transcript_31149:38-1333(-)